MFAKGKNRTNGLFIQKTLIIAALIGFILYPISVVHAASWARGIQGDCSNSTPKGDAWLNWEGYTIFNWGEALENLFWWNGSSWIKYSSGNDRQNGSSGVAWAHSTAAFRTGNWQVVGIVQGNFLPWSGWSDQLNYDYICS